MLFIILNININNNIDNNKQVLKKLNSMFLSVDIALFDEKLDLVNLEVNNIDYIGTIKIEKYNLLLPVKSICNNSYLSIESACTYSKSPLIILGTNLKDSLKNFKVYNEGDKVLFTNTLGTGVYYKIKDIIVLDNIDDILNYNEDLIIAIKNYYNMEYTLLICEVY